MNFKSRFLILFLLSSVICHLSFVGSSRADELTDLQKQLDQLHQDLNTKQTERAKTQSSQNTVSAKVTYLHFQIDAAAKEIEIKKKIIAALDAQKGVKETDLSKKTEERNQLLRSYYITSQISPVQFYLGSQSFSQLAQNITYYKAVALEGRRQVSVLGSQVIDIKLNLISNGEKKAQLENDVKALNLKKKDLDLQLTQLNNQLSQVGSQINNIEGEIAKISARQQQLLAEKTGGFSTSVGDVPAADDPASRLDFDPGFRPAFAGFSFGAPHRKGMSQYGAWGRAKSGQNYQDILKAYFGNVSIEHRDLPGSISTTVGTLSLEDKYLLGIAEMPSSWADDGGFEALKAQAVAARSYAMVAGKPICVTESCQVYSSGKAGSPPDAWRRAVNDTRGQVVVANGNILSTWYAASSGGYNNAYTSGGFTTNGGWDTKCGDQSCWTGDAYEKISGSPWFYKSWYKPRRTAASRSHPWLTDEEFTDIVNAILLYQKDSGVISHLSQIDKSNPDTWSREEVRQPLGGDVIDSVSGVTVTYSNGGFTGNVHLETNKGGRDVDGATFRQIFNMRAPGEIWLASSLFNIERK